MTMLKISNLHASVEGTEKKRVPASAIATSVSPALLPACACANRRKPGPRDVNIFPMRPAARRSTRRARSGSCGCDVSAVTLSN